MMTWGNANAKMYFEHKVPTSYHIPNEYSSVQETTRWIRDKRSTCVGRGYLSTTGPIN